MRWPWVKRKIYDEVIEGLKEISDNQITEINRLRAENISLNGTNRDLSQTNKTLSAEMNEANKYARALEESFNGNKSHIVMDYGRNSLRDLQERMQVTRIVRPDCMSRELGFQIRIPEDWKRIFDNIDRLSDYITHQVRGLLE